MTRFEHCLVASAMWVVDRILKRELRRLPEAAPAACAPQPGPHWKPYEVVLREQRLYGATMHGWSVEHVRRKAELIWARESDGLEFDWKEIETMDVKVTEVR